MVLQRFDLNNLFTFPATGEHWTVFPVVNVNRVLVKVLVHFITKVALHVRVVIVFLLLLLVLTLFLIWFLGHLSIVLFLALILFMFRFMLLQVTLSLVYSFFSDALSICLDSVGVDVCLDRHTSLTIVVVKLLFAFSTVNF